MARAAHLLLAASALLLAACAASSGAHVPEDPAAESAVRAALLSYYDALSDRDWPRYQEHFWSGATLTSVWTPPGEASPRVVATSVPDFVTKAHLGPGSREIFEERMLSAHVVVEGCLAQAWARYAARFGDPGDLMEWRGIDAFTLLYHDGAWRITSLAYAAE